MNRITTSRWLLIIFLCTAMLETYNISVQSFSDKPVVRILLLGYLFFLTIKRVQWARFVLATLYVLGGVIGINAFSSGVPSSNSWILGGFGVFCVLASVFLVRSKALNEPIVIKENNDTIGLDL